MRVAIYPGSFDPPTLGHMDIIERAARLFDRVIVGVGTNSAKAGFITVADRIEALQACTVHLENVECSSFSGLLMDYAAATGAQVIIRGLRAVSDFDYEFQIAIANRRLRPEVDTLFLMTKWEYSYISSSVVREVAKLGGAYETFVPPLVVPWVERAVKTAP